MSSSCRESHTTSHATSTAMGNETLLSPEGNLCEGSQRVLPLSENELNRCGQLQRPQYLVFEPSEPYAMATDQNHSNCKAEQYILHCSACLQVANQAPCASKSDGQQAMHGMSERIELEMKVHNRYVSNAFMAWKSCAGCRPGLTFTAIGASALTDCVIDTTPVAGCSTWIHWYGGLSGWPGIARIGPRLSLVSPHITSWLSTTHSNQPRVDSSRDCSSCPVSASYT